MSDLIEPPQRKKNQKSEALWMMSFSDMALVLLCFFVLMIASMKQDKEKFNHIKDGMVSEKLAKKTASVRQIAEKLKKIIKDKKLENKAQVTYDANGLQIELKNQLLFKSGSATMNRNFDLVAGEVMSLIAGLGKRYQILIEGHTDDAPAGGRGRNTNWELSADRGFTMLRRLNRLGVKQSHLAVIAYAHTHPKVPYQGLKGRKLREARSKNRRVVIRIE